MAGCIYCGRLNIIVLSGGVGDGGVAMREPEPAQAITCSSRLDPGLCGYDDPGRME